MGPWLETPAGRYALSWTQSHMDRAVADAFGYHALQLGLPELDGLRANRMPHRWVAHDGLVETQPILMPPPADESISTQSPEFPVALHCAFDALPFPPNSIDLVLLPHTLELARDPHATLAEVERVLVPEGRVVIIGFNPMSLWGLRQWLGLGPRIGLLIEEAEPGSHAAEFLGYRRVRDWLRLLSFEIEGGRFGCWRPPHATHKALERMAWMDRVGSHWWPVLGGLYGIEAVKRVRGMRLVGLARKPSRRNAAAPAVVAQRRRGRVEEPVGRVPHSR
jgi:SAM-dependent methyltransferase